MARFWRDANLLEKCTQEMTIASVVRDGGILFVSRRGGGKDFSLVVVGSPSDVKMVGRGGKRYRKNCVCTAKAVGG